MDRSNLEALALLFLNGVGPVLARRLVSYLGGVDEVFSSPNERLEQVPGIGKVIVQNLNRDFALKRASEEIKMMEKYGVNFVSFIDQAYPKRLKEFDDSPLVLFYKGDISALEHKHSVAVVGTRKATAYGKNACQSLISEFVNDGYNPVIVSGLAYGIDYCAHKTALQENLKTIAVLGHGLERVYPASHRNLASEIIYKGGMLVSEYPIHSNIEPKQFVRRNKIIALLSDLTVVVESGENGGALLTARYANEYNRKVYAVPGRINDVKSIGCNNLIKDGKAKLITGAKQIETEMKWESRPVQQKLEFISLSQQEQLIVDVLKKHEKLSVDQISYRTSIPVHVLLGVLMQMELKGLVTALPGNFYVMNN